MSEKNNKKTDLIEAHFSDSGLPVRECLGELVARISDSRLVALKAPPGSGKTILLPTALMEELGFQRVLVLEPRRVTARLPAIALAEVLGSLVGYRIRLESRWDREKTRVGYLTYGTALRVFLDKPLCSQDLVVFDEFHERSWEAELLLAHLRNLPNGPKLLLMSATLDLTGLPQGLPIVESDGRLHPVNVSWETKEPQLLGNKNRLAQLVAQRSSEWAARLRGEQLIFLPGLAEIRSAASLLENDHISGPVDILHSSLPEKEIRRVVERPKDAGFRRILSTNLAESSVTLPGIKVVIDAGLVRRPIRDQLDLGVTLTTQGAPMSALEQRAGRAGRLGPGSCHRLFTRQEELHRSSFPIPEIEQADYKTLVLFLASAEILDSTESLPWLHQPDKSKLARAVEWCQRRGLISSEHVLTTLGSKVLSLPLDPRLALFCCLARKSGCSLDTTVQWALALERSPPSVRAHSLEEWSRAQRAQGIDKRLENRVRGSLEAQPADGPGKSLQEVLLYVYSDTLCQLTTDRAVSVQPDQPALHFDPQDKNCERDLAVLLKAIPRGGQGPRSAVSLFQPVSRELVWEALFDSLHEKEEVIFDRATSSVKVRRQTLLGALVLESDTRLASPGPKPAYLLSRELTPQHYGDRFSRFARRLELLLRSKPEKVDDISRALALECTLESWRADLCHSFLCTITRWEKSSPDQLMDHIRGVVPYSLQTELERELPSELHLPGRRKPVRVEYPSDGDPYICSKLQHFFGWEQPKLLAGSVPLVCHLLAPNGRACQITTDLKSFWQGSYKQVRKDLRGRYPKHDWPESPPV